MPTIVSITAENDADFYQLFQYTLSDGVTPINISGATFRLGIRRNLADAATMLLVTSTLSNSGQVAIWNGALGQFSVWVTMSALQALPLGTWQQSLIINLPSSQFGVPQLSQVIWGGSSTITVAAGASR